MSGNELNVSVKALLWENYPADESLLIDRQYRLLLRSLSVCGAYFIADRNDEYRVEKGALSPVSIGKFEDLEEAKAAAQADYEARILSALSPQPVTNPAMGGGWMPIETAPKDGSIFLAVTVEAQKPTACMSRFDNGRFMVLSKGEKFEVGGWSRWWPTHWMPLPAPPATTGGKEL